MSDYNIYKEIFNSHEIFFEKYLKQFSPEIDLQKFSNWRLSYINYLTDVNLYFIYIIIINIVSGWFFPRLSFKGNSYQCNANRIQALARNIEE